MSPIHTRRIARAAVVIACACVAACAEPPRLYTSNPYGLGDGGVTIRRIAIAPVIGPVQWLDAPSRLAAREAGGLAVSLGLGDALLLEAVRFPGFVSVSPAEVASVSPGAPGWTSRDGAASLAQLLDVDAIIAVRVTGWNPTNELRLTFDIAVTLAEPIALGEVDARPLLGRVPGMTRNIAVAYQR
jgi:hypothetical protein